MKMKIIWCITINFCLITSGNFCSAQNIAAGGSQSLSLCTNNTVQGWGYNNLGQLGTGTPGVLILPTTTLFNGMTAVAMGVGNSLTIKNDSTVWAWGYNANGQLGDNSTIDRHAPVIVNLLTGVTEVSAGYNHSMALKSNGTVWAFGLNSYGELGNGSFLDSHIPLQTAPLCTTSGVTEIFYQPDINIYPNPALGTFTIKVNNGSKNAQLQIFNNLRQTIYSKNNISTQTINVEFLAPGIYFVKVLDGEKIYCKKLIVEHD